VFYGTTVDGGEGSECYYGCGTVFKVDATGKESVLYSFTAGTDGTSPAAGLVRDSVGDVYGTTYYGGNATCNKGENSGCGTVFKVTQSGKETPLYIFTGGTDGAYPYADLLMDAKGNFFCLVGKNGAPGSLANSCMALRVINVNDIVILHPAETTPMSVGRHHPSDTPLLASATLRTRTRISKRSFRCSHGSYAAGLRLAAPAFLSRCSRSRSSCPSR
jgi:uncharacterized repeat protein (TIGR03803 family)